MDVLQTLAMEVPFTEEEFRNEKKKNWQTRTLTLPWNFSNAKPNVWHKSLIRLSNKYTKRERTHALYLSPSQTENICYNISCNLKENMRQNGKEVVSHSKSSCCIIGKHGKPAPELGRLSITECKLRRQKDPLADLQAGILADLFDAMVK